MKVFMCNTFYHLIFAPWPECISNKFEWMSAFKRFFFVIIEDFEVFVFRSPYHWISRHKIPVRRAKARMSIPYRRPYRFGHRYDIFRIPVNTGVPFRVYRYFLYLYIYICMYVCMYVCVCVIINIKVYHKTFPQFRTNYSWFYTLVLIKWEKK